MEQKYYFSLVMFFCLLFYSNSIFSQVTPGDLNNDGKVDSADITRGVQIALGQPPPATQAEIEAGDMNRDGRITVQDLVFIRNTIAGGNRPPVADASATPDSGLTGTDIQLDATRSFDLDGDQLAYRWQQLHMNRYSTEYMTENEALLSDSTSATPMFNPEWPGNYRFELQVAESAGLVNRDTVDVWVRKEGVRHLDVKGIGFDDVFGEHGGPSSDNLPVDPNSMQAVLERAMDGAVRANAEWISIVPAAWYARINPLPEIRSGPNDLSLTVESDYAAIVAAAHAKGLKVVHREQLGAGILPLRPGEIDSLDILMSSSADWWDHWFTEWKNYILSRVDWTQKYGVEMFVLLDGAQITLRPAIYPQYGDRWREIISAVRTRYAGAVALKVFSTAGLNFADALDALWIGVFPLEYALSDDIADIRHPTLDEIRNITEGFFDGNESDVGGKVKVFYDFGFNSSDGQVESEPPPPLSELDFQEQVIYHDAFFQALEDENWISGVFSLTWSWFDEFDHPGIFFDNFVSSSPRSKPAEKLIKLWFGIF